MTPASVDLSGAAERRFDAYLEAIAGVLGHADRVGPARAYCTGLLLPGARARASSPWRRVWRRSACRRPISPCIT